MLSFEDFYENNINIRAEYDNMNEVLFRDGKVIETKNEDCFYSTLAVINTGEGFTDKVRNYY